VIAGQLRIVAKTKDEAEEIAAYLHRLSGGRAWFGRPKQGREGDWIAVGEVEMPADEDTRTWTKAREE
jgi:hypothetical protein